MNICKTEKAVLRFEFIPEQKSKKFTVAGMTKQKIQIDSRNYKLKLPKRKVAGLQNFFDGLGIDVRQCILSEVQSNYKNCVDNHSSMLDFNNWCQRFKSESQSSNTSQIDKPFRLDFSMRRDTNDRKTERNIQTE